MISRQPHHGVDHMRLYLRDGVPGLSMRQQEAMLVAANISIEPAYRDHLSKAEIKRRDPFSLKARAKMLDDCLKHPPEMIAVASLRVLGWTMGDIIQTLATLAKHKLFIHAVKFDQSFYVDAAGHDLLKALVDVEKEQIQGRTIIGRSVGVQAAADTKLKRSKTRLEEAWPLWLAPNAEISAAEIADRVKLSVTTMKRHFGSREDARAKASKESV